MKDSNQLLINAFMKAEKLDNQKMKREDEIIWEFSSKFENSMNKLLRKNERIKLSTRRNIRKRLLAAVIAIIILFTGLMSVSATRKPFVEFVKKIFPEFNQISISEESTPVVNTIETVYTLTDIPDEYVLAQYQYDEYSVFTVWRNEDGKEIVLFQNILETGFNVNNEQNYRELRINGYEAYLNEYEFNSTLLWTDGIYWFSLNVPNDIKSDIIEIAENISKKN